MTLEGIEEEGDGNGVEEYHRSQEITGVELSQDGEDMEGRTGTESAIPVEYSRTSLNTTPCVNEMINENFFASSQGTRNKGRILRDSYAEKSIALPCRDRNKWSLMYVDDLNIGEVHDTLAAKSTFSQHKEEKMIHAKYCEEMFRTIERNSREIGMRINESKTQLICVSDNNHANIKSYIRPNNERIECSNEMKILGFVFSNRPTVKAHIFILPENSIMQFGPCLI